MMSRSHRLLLLLQRLREHRFPVSAQQLAQQLNVSVRTIYRDIDSLREQGADIQGEAGIGYQLRAGFLLPPMMWDDAEIEAMILSARWLAHLPDPEMQRASTSILAKLEQVLPHSRLQLFEETTLYSFTEWLHIDQQMIQTVRLATRQQHKLRLHYQDEKQQYSERIVWPISIGYFNQTILLAAWCELREDFRHFRLDRMQQCECLGEVYPEFKRDLFKEWHQQCIEQYQQRHQLTQDQRQANDINHMNRTDQSKSKS